MSIFFKTTTLLSCEVHLRFPDPTWSSYWICGTSTSFWTFCTIGTCTCFWTGTCTIWSSWAQTLNWFFSRQEYLPAQSGEFPSAWLTVMLNHFSCFFFYVPSTKLGICPFSLQNTSSKGPCSIAMLVLLECKSLTKWHIAFVALRPASAWSAP